MFYKGRETAMPKIFFPDAPLTLLTLNSTVSDDTIIELSIGKLIFEKIH